MYFLIISITVIFDKRDNFLLKYFISVLLYYLASSCVVNNDDHRNIFWFLRKLYLIFFTASFRLVFISLISILYYTLLEYLSTTW